MKLEFDRLSTGPLLFIAVAAIATLLVLILVVKLHALMALVIVSVGTAIATRIPVGHIMDVILGGFGETLGEIALLIAFGVMFARLLETSGGSLALSNYLIDKLGEKRAPLALGIASLLFGLPIFFDAAFMVMLPLYLAVARRLGGSMLMYVLPPAAALSTMHVFMPPHPGVVTAGVLLGGDVGLVMMLGLIIAIPTWLCVGYVYGSWIGKRIVLPIPEVLAGGPKIAEDSDAAQSPPKVITLLGLLTLPLVLIFGNLLSTTLAKTGAVDKNATWVGALQLVGSIPVALLITVLASTWLLGTRRGRGRAAIEDMLENSLKPIAPVLLVTGAGGMFSAVLLLSGIGDALAQTLRASGLPLTLAVFFISGIMRLALGGTTIAITTAAGLLGGAIMNSGLSPIQTAAIVLVMAGGSAILPHVNDPTFWLIGRLLGMDVVQTLKTWTVLKTLMGTVGALFASAIFYLA